MSIRPPGPIAAPSNQRTQVEPFKKLTTQIFRLTSPKIYWKAICKMVGPEFLRFSDLSPFVRAMVWTKETVGRCPWWMHLLYTLLREYSLVKLAWLSSCKIIISTFNFLCIESSISPKLQTPRFSRQLLQRSSNFLWGLAWHFASRNASGWPPTWPYTSSTTRLIPSSSSLQWHFYARWRRRFLTGTV